MERYSYLCEIRFNQQDFMKFSELYKILERDGWYIGMKKVTVIIEKGDELYSAYVNEGIESVFLNGQGNSVDEAVKDMHFALEECKQSYIENGEPVPEDIAGEITFEYKYDVASLFNFFDEINLSSFARKNNMNESLLRKYKRGLAFASEKQCKRIEKGLHELGQKLCATHLSIFA